MKPTQEENLLIVYENPDFSLCGVKIEEMVYDKETKLFSLKPGVCRVTAAHLISAIYCKNYKKHLEKEISFRGK